MSLIKKSDVKNHISERHQKRIHVAPLSQPDATGFSGTNETSETSRSSFTQDFTGDHTTAGLILFSGESTAKPDAQAPCDLAPEKL